MSKVNELLENIKNNYNVGKMAIVLGIVLCAVFFYFFTTRGGDEIVIEEDSGETSTTENVEPAESKNRESTIFVDISGEVKNCGVYEMKEGDRVFHVIEKAGGLKKNADVEAINQAQVIIDGEKIVIPRKGKGNTSLEQGGDNGKININTADIAKLDEISGVGPSTANKIIEYRENSGTFKNIEDIKNVSGIGDKTFEKIKNDICV